MTETEAVTVADDVNRELLEILAAQFPDPKPLGMSEDLWKRGRKLYWETRDCIYHGTRYARQKRITHVFTTQQVKTYALRCGQTNRCPHHLAPDNIVKSMSRDYAIFEKAAAHIGQRYGQGIVTRLVVAETPTKIGARRFMEALTRNDHRYSPILRYPISTQIHQYTSPFVHSHTDALGGLVWTAEFARHLTLYKSIKNLLSVKCRATCIFIGLLTSLEGVCLDEDRLQRYLPGATVTGFGEDFKSAWEACLGTWASYQVGNRTAWERIGWMLRPGRLRLFEAIGGWRGVKAQAQKEHLDKLHASEGYSAMAVHYDSSDRAEPVVRHAGTKLYEGWRKVTGERLGRDQHSTLMAVVRTDVEKVAMKGARASTITKSKGDERMAIRSELSKLGKKLASIKTDTQQISDIVAEIKRLKQVEKELEKQGDMEREQPGVSKKIQ